MHKHNIHNILSVPQRSVGELMLVCCVMVFVPIGNAMQREHANDNTTISNYFLSELNKRTSNKQQQNTKSSIYKRGGRTYGVFIETTLTTLTKDLHLHLLYGNLESLSP